MIDFLVPPEIVRDLGHPEYGPLLVRWRIYRGECDCSILLGLRTNNMEQGAFFAQCCDEHYDFMADVKTAFMLTLREPTDMPTWQVLDNIVEGRPWKTQVEVEQDGN